MGTTGLWPPHELELSYYQIQMKRRGWVWKGKQREKVTNENLQPPKTHLLDTLFSIIKKNNRFLSSISDPAGLFDSANLI